MQHLNYRNFAIAAIATFIAGIILLSVSLWIGKINFFLLLNTDLGIVGDWVFRIMTYAGDGLIWITILLIVVWGMKRKDLLPLLISSFIFSTLFTQICKHFIAPDQMRPGKVITDHSLFHSVQGIELHHFSSFPSGHTATAFTCYLFFCLLINKRWWVFVGLIFALEVGYSRIYLAQHFPRDVSAGMLVAVVSVLLSLPVQNYYKKQLA